VQFQSPLRTYSPGEKEKLVEMFGTPERWGDTLRNKFWCHSHATANAFQGSTEVVLSIPCSFDLTLAATKYFYALESGEIPLLFLFSGTVFYAGDEGKFQVQQISWNKECSFRVPIGEWKTMMDRQYPNTAWLTLHRDVFDRLYAFKRANGLATWEQTIERLLLDETAIMHGAEKVEVTPTGKEI
jgi:hypothetical protein